MAGPWEKYQPATPAAPTQAGPWDRFKAAPPAAPATPALADTGTNLEQNVSQDMSGVNEGIAGTLGAPVDLVNFIMRSTGLPSSDTPFLGSQSIKDMMGETLIKPPTNNVTDRIGRSIGSAVGGAAIPELGLTARAGGTLADVARGLIPAATSGLGGGVAEEVAPNNPVAHMAGELIGGVVPSTALSTVRAVSGGGRLPAIEDLVAPNRNADLRQATTDAYDAADAAGAQYSPHGFGQLAQTVATEAAADNISATRHPAASHMLQRFTDYAANGYSPTLTQLDQLRQEVSRDLARHADDAEGHFGRMMLRSIDNFIANAGPGQMAAGAGPAAKDAITTARAANTRLAKTNNVDDAILKARTNTAASGSGGNINNALRQQMKQFLTDPELRRGLSTEELAAITRVVETGPIQNALRVVGKLAPGGNGLMAALNLGAAAATHGMSLAVPAAATLAKSAADGITENRVTNVRDLVSGRQTQRPPFFNGAQRRGLTSAAASAATNNDQAVIDAITRN